MPEIKYDYDEILQHIRKNNLEELDGIFSEVHEDLVDGNSVLFVNGEGRIVMRFNKVESFYDYRKRFFE